MTVRSNVIFGMFPGDIIIRTAIIAGIEEMRAEPGLIDFLLQALLKDELTKKQYGERELTDLKDWILNNDIAVTMGYHINQVKGPHIAIWLGAASETQQILGDIHEIPIERIQWDRRRPPALIFTPAAYDQTTGLITLPAGLSTAQIHAGMRVLDRLNNRVYEIEAVEDDQSFRLPAGTAANLTNAEVLEREDVWLAQVESVSASETYNIDCLVSGDATKCILLHSLLVFILYRYKQRYLEARGFENTVVNSTAMGGVQPDATQIIWKRSVTITGTTRQYWPKAIGPAVQGIQAGLVIETGSTATPELATVQNWSTTQAETPPFDADADSIQGLR